MSARSATPFAAKIVDFSRLAPGAVLATLAAISVRRVVNTRGYCSAHSTHSDHHREINMGRHALPEEHMRVRVIVSECA
jgi:hypothetical protein